MTTLSGDSSSNTLIGTSSADTISGNGGNDTILAGGGSDKISGGSGSDTVLAGSGNDTVYAGTGNDTAYAGTGNDKVWGEGGNDVIYGEAGNDWIDGGSGNDTLLGGAGYDTLLGGAGYDTLSGGSGNDTLVGGAGADQLTGGGGNDTFVYLAASDSQTVTGSLDSIVDFTHGSDKIDLTAFRGAQELNWSNTTVGTKYGVWYDRSGTGTSVDSTFVYVDTDGNGEADLKIELKNTSGLTLTSSDFIGVNQGPVAVHDTATTSEDHSTVIDVLANDLDDHDDHDELDLDGHVLTLVSVVGPADKGSASVVNNQVVFNPGTDFDHLQEGATEQVTLTYTMQDEFGVQSSATVDVTITGANDQPTLSVADDTGALTEGDGTPTLTDSGALSFADVDVNDVVTVSQSSNNDIVWSGGTIDPGLAATLVGGFNVDQDSWDYSTSANLDFLGAGETITFSYNVVAKDDSGTLNNFDDQTVTITITGTNDALNSPPNAYLDHVLTNVPSGIPFTIPGFALLANDTDADNDQLSIGTVENLAMEDKVELLSGNVTYTYNAPQDGSFQYTAYDGTSPSKPATVMVDTQVGNFASGSEVVNGTDANEILIASNNIIPAFYTLNAGGGNDFLFGGAAVDVLNGGDGDDFLFGGAGGGDELYGEAGNDTLSGGDDLDIDFLVGGDGVDLLDFSHEITPFSFTLGVSGSGIAIVDGADMYFEMEGVIGGSGDDSLTGNDGDNILQGGAGDDALTGGTGSDIFDYNALSDRGTMGDTIVDFTATGDPNADKLDLHDLLMTFGGYDGTNAVYGGYLDTSSLVNMVVRVDSDGGADSFVTLATVNVALDVGDFIL